MDSTTENELNEKRCIANEIIFELFHAKQRGQIASLLMACSLSHKQLDPEGHRKWLEFSLATMSAPSDPSGTEKHLAALDSTK